MTRVKITTPFPEWPLARQTPHRSAIWGNCHFFINQPDQECDWWVVYEDLLVPESAVCPRDHTIFITAEPPSVKTYPRSFLEQFGTVITCHSDLNHSNIIRSQQALPWHVGRCVRGHENLEFRLDYDQLRSLGPDRKSSLLSLISSDKVGSEGHRCRAKFIRRVAEHFKERLAVFGRGFREVEDKWDVIARCRYHIVLENSAVRDYWTEKLSDAYLGWAYPIYYGCPNLGDYFPNAAFVTIDIDDHEGSIDQIEHAIAAQTFEREFDRLREARTLVLERYNLFAMLDDLCRGGVSAHPREVRILPQASFISEGSGYHRIVKRLLHRLHVSQW